jgi:uncharacterized protein YaiL (DUF2058 family)
MESLQEQLLKAGLVDKNRANKARKDKQKQSKLARNTAAKNVNREKSAAQKEHEKRVERDRELNQQRQKQAEQKAVLAQIKQLIDLNKIDCAQGVKKIFVTDDIKQQLSQGRLAIVRLVLKSERLFEIVPTVIAEKIAQRDENAVVQLVASVDKVGNEDDPYADYQIPDDLTW